MLYKRSSMLFSEAKKYIPGGVNSPVEPLNQLVVHLFLHPKL